MQHSNTGQDASPRLRPSRAPSKPPRGGGGGRLVARVVAADLPVVITADDRARIASNLEMLLAFLDALDGDTDAEDTDFDCCPAGDDDPARSRPVHTFAGSYCASGEPDDAEEDDPDEPSLGTPEVGTSGQIDTRSNYDLSDLECDRADDEPDCDEPDCDDRDGRAWL